MFQVRWVELFLLHLEGYLCGVFLGLNVKSGVCSSLIACTLTGWNSRAWRRGGEDWSGLARQKKMRRIHLGFSYLSGGWKGSHRLKKKERNPFSFCSIKQSN